MKRLVWILALAMGGCATVSDIRQAPPTLAVISGKEPKAYGQCVVDRLADSRGAMQMEPYKGGIRIIVAQKLSMGPAAILEIDDRSGGSSIKLYERMSNMPLRPQDVREAATACISG
ncbi:hypothetical protein [Pseudomonas sp. Irchel 3E20]|uniref:hypothetical protein n=1 Tax=Pseudomonas sp. Irchel 3E20 TaxID=2008983 RepID=UPI000BA3A612|nr:hypothetical protein [Pseudomonas sp. Irchel 3E20]